MKGEVADALWVEDHQISVGKGIPLGESVRHAVAHLPSRTVRTLLRDTSCAERTTMQGVGANVSCGNGPSGYALNAWYY